jgi:hypothetical protein
VVTTMAVCAMPGGWSTGHWFRIGIARLHGAGPKTPIRPANTPAQALNRGFDEHTLEAVTLSVYSRGWVPPRVSVAPETNGRVHPQ